MLSPRNSLESQIRREVWCCIAVRRTSGGTQPTQPFPSHLSFCDSSQAVLHIWNLCFHQNLVKTSELCLSEQRRACKDKHSGSKPGSPIKHFSPLSLLVWEWKKKITLFWVRFWLWFLGVGQERGKAESWFLSTRLFHSASSPRFLKCFWHMNELNFTAFSSGQENLCWVH